jgi:Mn2+/Fe2+ NRAMP family transporter
MTSDPGDTAIGTEVIRPGPSIRRRSTVRGLLRVLGPAWIVMLADVDAPSVLTAAKAGTDFGYAILLPVIALIPVLYLVQEMTARLAIGTGLGHAELIRERYGFGWGAVAVISTVVIDLLAYTAQFAGIVLGASLLGIAAGPAVVGALIIHSVIVLTRSYRQFEVVAIVLSMALFAFVVLAVTTGPDLGAVLAGLSPRQPFDRPGYLDLVVATIGAVIMPWMLFYQQAATVDKGLGPADLPAARTETLVGAIASEVLMAAILIASATAALSGGGASSVAGGLALPAGLANLATGGTGVLIAMGIIGSGLLAAVVISLSSAWAWSELFRWPHSLNVSLREAPAFYALYLLEVVPAAVVALLAQDLVAVVFEAMILNVVVLAIPLTFLVRLSSDRRVLGPLVNSRRRSALLWALTAGLLGLGLTSAFGLLGGGV